MLRMPYYLALKAASLHLADRVSEALEAISEAEALVERFEERRCCAELHRLRGVFLVAMGAEEAQSWRSNSAPVALTFQSKFGARCPTKSSGKLIASFSTMRSQEATRSCSLPRSKDFILAPGTKESCAI
jgi:hypothetical protein